ncbi:alpha-amylase domain-containing protein [Natranaeroarchaeum aerophilus]|uniref:DUF1939 domain-containing protein n=1 Tax=Natranaeroarchaeum aerophilus TaxID=2917711 RepID=A0AAE3FNN3_9EURY|nr:alpha-amylase domain-containing protein [Natranaeroarchaeum aerophilus]MCL9812301.1 DUF1939 domain-containing protein [Natranaeroarchaeum aerophilus]
MSEGNTGVHRRDVLKGISGAAVASGVASGASGTVAAGDAPGETTMLQYFHTDWTEMEANMSTVADAGFDAIHVPAPQESVLTEDDQGDEHPEYGPNYPYHPPLGYQPFDRTSLDSEFGTETQFRSMIDEAHDQGIDVIVDIVLNHNGASVPLDDFPNVDSEHFYQEGGIEGWEYAFDPNDDDCFEDGEPKDPNRWECDPWRIEHHDLVGLPTLDWTTDTVQDLAYDYLQLIADCGADGVRWDAAKHMHNWVFEDFLNPWADELGLYTVGEVLFGPIGYIDEYAQTGMDITDYALFYTMREEAFTTGGDFRTLDGDDAGYVAQNPFQSLTMIANHDSAPPELEALARAFILTYEGYPRVYNYLIDFDDPGLQNLLWIRSTLLGGSAITRYVDEDVIIYEREDNAVVALNKSGSERTEDVSVPWTDEPLQEYTGNADDTEADADGWSEITAPAGGWAVYAPEDAAGDPPVENDDLDGGGDDGGDGELTLRIDAPTAEGESVYFTGTVSELTGWGTGVEGTNVDGDTWELTIDDPGSFEWKTRRGPSAGDGDVWEDGSNHTSETTAPSHQGWEDGFDGTNDDGDSDDGGSDDGGSDDGGSDDGGSDDGGSDDGGSDDGGSDDGGSDDGGSDDGGSDDGGSDDGGSDDGGSDGGGSDDGGSDDGGSDDGGSDDGSSDDGGSDDGSSDDGGSDDGGPDDGGSDNGANGEADESDADADDDDVSASESETDDGDDTAAEDETNDSDAGTPEDDTGPADDDLPGFGIGATVSAIGGGLLAGKRLLEDDTGDSS